MTWSGRRSTTARRHFAPLLPLPCARCGLPVLPDQRWQVGHRTDRVAGGTDDLANLWPEHGVCNERAGQATAARRNRRRRAGLPTTSRVRAW